MRTQPLISQNRPLDPLTLEPLVAPELEFVLAVLLIALVWLAVVTIVIWALSRIRRLF